MSKIPKLFWILILSSLLALSGLILFIGKQGAMVMSMAEKITGAQDLPALEKSAGELESMKLITREQKLALWSMLAGRYGQLGDNQKMYAVFESTLKLDPENAGILNNLSYEWARQGINLQKAEEYSKKAVELADKAASGKKPAGMSRERWERINKQERGNYLDTYGWVLYQMGNYPQALRELQKAFDLVNEPTIQYHLGMAQYKNGYMDGAIDNIAASLAGRLEDPETAKSELEAIYKEKNKTLRGLDKLLQQAADKVLARQQAEDEADASQIVGKPAPDFSLPDLTDKTHKLAEYRGTVLILDFWATWCGPCKLAMPLVNKVYLEYKDKGLEVFGINLEGREKKELVEKFIEKTGYQFTILQGGIMGVGIDQTYGVTGIPTTFVIDKQGIIRYRHIGYRENLDQLLAREIEELLKQ